MGKSMVSGSDFPWNQSIDIAISKWRAISGWIDALRLIPWYFCKGDSPLDQMGFNQQTVKTKNHPSGDQKSQSHELNIY